MTPDPLSLKLTRKERRILEANLRKWKRKLKPLYDAIRESERITGEDLVIRINARPEDR